MATIRKRGSKYQVQVRHKNTPPVSKSFCKRSDAVEWARQMEVEADRKCLTSFQSTMDDTTLGEMLQKYDTEVIEHKRSRDVQRTIIRALLRHSICSKKLSDLQHSDFNQYRNERLEVISPTTFNHQIAIVQHAYQVAIVEWGWALKENPIKKLKKPKNGNGRERRLIEGEKEKLLDAATSFRNTLMRPLFLFALETAMRRGELLRLKWSDINPEKKTLHIPLAKNGCARTIPLTSTALIILAELSRADERVFPLTAEAVKQSWTRWTRKAGIEGLNFHDLRHEAITRFVECGLNIQEVALISGHKDYRMLARYTHLKAETLAIKLAQLS